MPRTISELANQWLDRKGKPLSDVESRVLKSALDRHAIARDVNEEHNEGLSAGDRISDSIARVGGSWRFILTFVGFLILWTVGGGVMLASTTFDPYPFIFLNLILSMVAALQAPIIMMSQNRQSEHDRMDAAHDYEVNLKAEIEIMALHEKFDDMRHQDILMLKDQIAELRGIILALKQGMPGANAAQ